MRHQLGRGGTVCAPRAPLSLTLELRECGAIPILPVWDLRYVDETLRMRGVVDVGDQQGSGEQHA